MRFTLRCALLLAAGCWSGQAFSAPQPGSVEIGAFAGAFFADSSAGVDDDVVTGARLAVFLGRLHEVELVVDRVETTFEGPTLGLLEDRYSSVTASWLFNFPMPRSRVVPYVFVGLGEMREKVEVPGAGTAEDDDLFVPIGGGFRVFSTPFMALRFEGRLKSFTTFDVTQSTAELSVGVTFVLGGR